MQLHQGRVPPARQQRQAAVAVHAHRGRLQLPVVRLA